VPKRQKLQYEEKAEIIDKEISKRKSKWRLTAITWMDYDDVSQIIRAHIFKKWDQWDQSRPIEPWLNTIISNQIKNLLRNNYQNFAKPCSGCPFNDQSETNGCSFTHTKMQDDNCPLYKKWARHKKNAYNIHLAVPIDAYNGDNSSQTNYMLTIDVMIEKVHSAMETNLSEKHYKIYKMLFIDSMSEEEVADVLGYKTNEVGRKRGYKQIKNLKSKFKKIAKKFLNNEDFIW